MARTKQTARKHRPPIVTEIAVFPNPQENTESSSSSDDEPVSKRQKLSSSDKLDAPACSDESGSNQGIRKAKVRIEFQS